MNTFATAQLWVHDQDEALAFYVDKLGWTVREDLTPPELGGFRWLTVAPTAESDTSVVLMAIPGEPVFTDETAGQVRDLLSKGAVGAIFLTTDDVQAEYEALKARGVDLPEPTAAAVGRRHRLPRPVRQPHPARPAGRDPRDRLSAMCLYGLPRSLTSADRITYPASGDDRDDLEVGEVLPVGDPRLELREVVALHELEAAR